MMKWFVVPVLVGLAAPVVAEPELFGSIDLHYTVTDTDKSEEYQLNDRGTRLGVRGAYALQEGLEASYILENATRVADEDKFIHEVRQAWLGLRGEWGELRFGRHLSPTRVSVSPLDLFDNQAADLNRVLESDTVHHRSLAYINRFDNVGVAVAVSTSDESNRLSTDVLVNYNFENVYLAAAYLHGSELRNTTRVSAQYRFSAGHKVSTAYEYQEDNQDNAGYNAYVLNGGYREGKRLWKAQLGWNDPQGAGKTETLWGVGLDYEWMPEASLQFQYSVNKYRDHSKDDRESTFSVGLNYRF